LALSDIENHLLVGQPAIRAWQPSEPQLAYIVCVDHARLTDLEGPAAADDVSAAGRLQIAKPVRSFAVQQRDDQLPVAVEGQDRGLVLTAGAPPAVDDD
jgi:hypothetical protein